MNTNEIKTLQEKCLIPTYTPELAIVRGEGCYVWDADGKKYLDFSTGISVCNLGHCHPLVTAAIHRQSATLVHVSNIFMNEQQPLLAATISDKSFGGKVFFANSGAEANEGMIKFARKWGHDRGKCEIICMSHSFHGRTLTTLAATDKPKYRAGFAPDMEGFRFAPFNDTAALRNAITERTVGILIEPVQGEGGVNVVDKDYLTAARELCDQQQLLLLFDEVQCGMGRTGHLFAYQHFGVEPDAMSLAKALGNGYPVGAFTVRNKWAHVLSAGSHASTFGGAPLACAAARAVFDAIEREDLLLNCRSMGERVKAGLLRMKTKFPSIKDVRGIGLMIGIEMLASVSSLLKKAGEKGLLVLSAGEHVIRLLPPLTISQDDIDHGLAILESVFAESAQGE